jgi:hypothetical protein
MVNSQTESRKSLLNQLFSVFKSNVTHHSTQKDTIPVTLSGMVGRNTSSNVIRLGVTKTGHLDWNVNVYPNLFLVGGSGTGKSVLQHSVFYHCLVYNDAWSVYAIDLLRVDTYPYRKYVRTVQEIATEVDAALILLKGIVENINSRYKLWEDEGFEDVFDVRKHSLKSIMLLMDAFYPTFSSAYEYVREDNVEHKQIMQIREMFEDILQRGKNVGIHVVWTSWSSEPQMDAEFAPHLNTIIATGRINTGPSQYFFSSDRAAQIPDYWMSGYVAGRGLAKFGDQIEEFQGCFVDDELAKAWVQEHGQEVEPELWKDLNSK